MLLGLAFLIGDQPLLRILPFIGVTLLTAALLGALAYRRSPPGHGLGLPQGRAFNLRQALLLALLFAALAAGVAWLQETLGSLATLGAATLAGLADAHATSSAAMALAARGELSPSTMQLAVLLAFSSNTVAKMVAAYAAGGSAYGGRVSAGLLLVALSAWGSWWLWGSPG